MSLNRQLAERQANAGRVIASLSTCGQGPELFEDLLTSFRRNARAAVGDGDAQPLVVGSHQDTDRAARRRVLDGVVQEIFQDSPDQARVTGGDRRSVDVELDV